MSLESRSKRWMEGSVEHPLRWPLLRAIGLPWLWTGAWLLAVGLSGNPRTFQVGPMLGAIVLAVGHASSRFASRDATEWALARGVWTRKDLARWTVLEIAVRGLSLFAAILLAWWLFRSGVMPIDPEEVQRPNRPGWLIDPAGSALVSVTASACAVWTVLVILMLIVQMQGCTWLPQRLASIRSSTKCDRRAVADFGLSALFFVLLSAPAVGIGLATRQMWPITIYGAALLIPLYACVTGQETGLNTIRREDANEPRIGGIRSHPGSARVALLWRALPLGTKATGVGAIVFAVGLYFATRNGPIDESKLAPAFLFALLLVLGILVTALLVKPFHWQSHGATADYLASLGVEFGRIRRFELSVGAALVAVLAAVWAWHIVTQGFTDAPVIFLLLFVQSIPLLASNRSVLHASSRLRVHKTLIPIWLGCLLLVPSVAFLFDRAVSQFIGMGTCALVFAFAAWQWIASWRRAGNEFELRELEFGRSK